MTKDNQDALRCADDMDQFLLTVPAHPLCTDGAAHLRRLVAENKAKDALLRQALEALEWAGHRGALVDAIRQHLEGRA